MKKIQNRNELLLSTNYRNFVEAFIRSSGSSGKKITYSSIARKAGFASRSYVREIVLGKKNLSPKSLHKFITGLGLSGEFEQFFRLLVELEAPECRLKPTNDSKIRNAIENLRARMLRGTREKPEMRSGFVFESRYLPRVYAALGTKEKGATLLEIQTRTGLPTAVLQSLLLELQKAELIQTSGASYLPTAGHLNFPHLSESEIFRRFFLTTLTEASDHAKKSLQSEKQLHFASCFSVAEQNLPAFKQELRALLLQFVDRSETPTGDRIVSLVCSLF